MRIRGVDILWGGLRGNRMMLIAQKTIGGQWLYIYIYIYIYVYVTAYKCAYILSILHHSRAELTTLKT